MSRLKESVFRLASAFTLTFLLAFTLSAPLRGEDSASQDAASAASTIEQGEGEGLSCYDLCMSQEHDWMDCRADCVWETSNAAPIPIVACR